MTREEKQILEMFAKYAEIVNAELAALNSRIDVLPGASAHIMSPGPQNQLSAIRTALLRLPS